HAGDDGRGADLRRLRLHEGVPRREAHEGREAAPDLRGDVADPAHGDRTKSALAALALIACAGPPEIEPVPLAIYGARGDDARCAWAVRCRHVPDEATCRRLLDPKNSDVRRAEDAVQAGRLAYDPWAAARCLVAAAGAECLAQPFGAPECADVFTGLRARGQSCSSDFECAGDDVCADRACGLEC